MKKLVLLLSGLLLALTAHATSPINLSDFTAFDPSYYGGSWSAGTKQSGPTAFTIGDFGGGIPKNDGSFTINLPSSLNITGNQYVNITGAAFAGNTTESFNFFLEDLLGNAPTATFQVADFAAGFASVNLAGLYSMLEAPGSIVRWGISTENQFGDEKFAFVFDQISLSASPIPEPSAYAALAGGLSLFAALLARRRRAAA